MNALKNEFKNLMITMQATMTSGIKYYSCLDFEFRSTELSHDQSQNWGWRGTVVWKVRGNCIRELRLWSDTSVVNVGHSENAACCPMLNSYLSGGTPRKCQSVTSGWAKRELTIGHAMYYSKPFAIPQFIFLLATSRAISSERNKQCHLNKLHLSKHHLS